MPGDFPSVAVVDDDAELVSTYELIFRRKRVPVAFVAYDGVSALDKFRNSRIKPGVVIVDHRMPQMDGLELTGEIKKLEPLTKVVFVSADNSVRQNALEAGADTFLEKPVGIKVLLESIGTMPGN